MHSRKRADERGNAGVIPGLGGDYRAPLSDTRRCTQWVVVHATAPELEHPHRARLVVNCCLAPKAREPNRSRRRPRSLRRHEATSRRSRVDLSPVRRHRSLCRRHGSGRVRVRGGLLVQATRAECVSVGVPLRTPRQPGVRITDDEPSLNEPQQRGRPDRVAQCGILSLAGDRQPAVEDATLRRYPRDIRTVRGAFGALRAVLLLAATRRLAPRPVDEGTRSPDARAVVIGASRMRTRSHRSVISRQSRAPRNSPHRVLSAWSFSAASILFAQTSASPAAVTHADAHRPAAASPRLAPPNIADLSAMSLVDVS